MKTRKRLIEKWWGLRHRETGELAKLHNGTPQLKSSRERARGARKGRADPREWSVVPILTIEVN